MVRETQTTANRDQTEGLFDGVMQVAVCGVSIIFFLVTPNFYQYMYFIQDMK